MLQIVCEVNIIQIETGSRVKAQVVKRDLLRCVTDL